MVGAFYLLINDITYVKYMDEINVFYIGFQKI